MQLHDVKDVVGAYDGLSRKVLDYSLTMRRLVDEAKTPGFTVERWAPLADIVDVVAFERIGNFLEVMGWREYTEFLTRWASTSEWACSFKRITEGQDVVFLELEERSRVGAFTSTVNSTSVYDFDKVGRLCRLGIYLQMAPPDPEMLAAYR